jgi:hypothetical protein
VGLQGGVLDVQGGRPGPARTTTLNKECVTAQRELRGAHAPAPDQNKPTAVAVDTHTNRKSTVADAPEDVRADESLKAAEEKFWAAMAEKGLYRGR